MDFHPPIHTCSTEELLKMASDAESWQPEARSLARVELDKRGVPTEDIRDREQAFSSASMAHHQLREQHAKESYAIGKMSGIFFSAPFVILGKIFGRKFGSDIKLGLTELDKRNYNRKYKQRMTLLVLGTVFWAILLSALT